MWVTQLLLHLFVPLSTPELLPLTVVSHRIYNVILRILHNRLVAAAELDSHSLLLECYHPSAKLTEPPYFCAYRGTDGLSLYESPSKADRNSVARLGEMRRMYSRFRPHRRQLEDGGRRVVRRPGDIPGSRTYPGSAQDKFQGDIVKQTVSLEGHELFTQLVAQTNLVKIGPYNGLFSAFVDVEEGVLRVWRKWLSETAARGNKISPEVQKETVEEAGKGKAAVCEVEEPFDPYDKRILWVSMAKNTGLRFNVKEKKLHRDAPILIRNDEDMPVSYDIEYDELLIRTSHLLLMLEKSMDQEDNSSAKAVVFGSFG
ncbi:F-box domain-containing protein [Didymella exigua CBS 183.55]|uniref:F-box domain-containing protein n=1 Tax=Didymella exigua CBS 183.55 TaxID=1150837 RepID=A0A6A5RDP8_9PLEO|nr:F-box domain-containing protein [Didymella exigua CBS 183.55]KAF1926385.1 F-box domain-containing protein [Didymella exigua CBS 183.55]